MKAKLYFANIVVCFAACSFVETVYHLNLKFVRKGKLICNKIHLLQWLKTLYYM